MSALHPPRRWWQVQLNHSLTFRCSGCESLVDRPTTIEGSAQSEELPMRFAAKSTCLFALLAIFVCLAPCLSLAQDLDNVTISGLVTDQNGAVIPRATVTA